MRNILRSAVEDAVAAIVKGTPLEGEPGKFTVEVPANPENGDFATNAALTLAKPLGKNPRAIAETLRETITAPHIEKIEIKGAGFINFFIEPGYFHSFLAAALKDDTPFMGNECEGRKMMVEFVSANPTGPLHIGHGRGAAFGDSLARILAAAGADVTAEYYVNDAGNQMNNLAASVRVRLKALMGMDEPFPEDGYRGDYIGDIAAIIHERYGDKLAKMEHDDLTTLCLREGVSAIKKMIADDLSSFRVSFDTWFSEKSLFDDGKVVTALAKLAERGHTYEADGALWFKSTAFGDDKDRVVKRANGEYTYFASDIAYHMDKYDRGFDQVINVWGADHHGYVKRLSSSVAALGIDEARLDISLIQMVNLMESGARVSMSTRAGEFIPLSWLVNEVGADAARFFYQMRSVDAQFDFDLDLARQRSNDNPVYYVQYAHARVFSLIDNARNKKVKHTIGENLALLTEPAEIAIIKKLHETGAVIDTAARHREPHRMVYFLQDLASMFHNYYYTTPITNPADPKLTGARLSLAVGVANAIRFGLDLIGVSAPEEM